MMSKSQITTEERERQKAARRRFREIVKQRWEEETLKNLSKKAIKKSVRGITSPFQILPYRLLPPKGERLNPTLWY